jgi:hypothetical protein
LNPTSIPTSVLTSIPTLMPTLNPTSNNGNNNIFHRIIDFQDNKKHIDAYISPGTNFYRLMGDNVRIFIFLLYFIIISVYFTIILLALLL